METALTKAELAGAQALERAVLHFYIGRIVLDTARLFQKEGSPLIDAGGIALPEGDSKRILYPARDMGQKIEFYFGFLPYRWKLDSKFHARARQGFPSDDIQSFLSTSSLPQRYLSLPETHSVRAVIDSVINYLQANDFPHYITEAHFMRAGAKTRKISETLVRSLVPSTGRKNQVYK